MPTPTVCSGAMLVCSYGAGPSLLTATPRPVFHVVGMAMATVNDCAPLINIAPFGSCGSPANPSLLPAKQCTPMPAGPWTAVAPEVKIGGIPILGQTAILTCAYGGVITIAAPKTTIPYLK